jgi:predicted secreted protein
MGELAGKLNVIKIATTAEGAGTAINGVDSSTFNRLCDILEITAFGDEYKARMAGLKDTNLSLSGNYDPADTNGQMALEPGDYVWVQVLPNGTTGKKVKMIVENFEHGAAIADKQTFSSSLQGVEAPTAVT